MPHMLTHGIFESGKQRTMDAAGHIICRQEVVLLTDFFFFFLPWQNGCFKKAFMATDVSATTFPHKIYNPVGYRDSDGEFIAGRFFEVLPRLVKTLHVCRD